MGRRALRSGLSLKKTPFQQPRNKTLGETRGLGGDSLFVFCFGLVLKVCFFYPSIQHGRPLQLQVQLTKVDSCTRCGKGDSFCFEDHHFPASYPRVRASVSRDLSHFVYPDLSRLFRLHNHSFGTLKIATKTGGFPIKVICKNHPTRDRDHTLCPNINTSRGFLVSIQENLDTVDGSEILLTS